MKRVSSIFLENVLSGEQCAHVLQNALQLPEHNADMGKNPDFPEIRSSTVRWIYGNNPVFGDLFANLQTLIRNANFTSFGYHIDLVDSLQFTEYHGHRRGTYDWHIDLFQDGEAEKDRKLSFVVQLSRPDAYHGGDLQIHCQLHPHPALLRNQGSMVIFPSFLEHRVTEVTSGTRYSLVGWVLGNRLQ